MHRCLIQSLIYLISLQALLSGCSAGGLATLIHCDDFRKFLPKDATVKCLSDAGFFLDEYVLCTYYSPFHLFFPPANLLSKELYAINFGVL